jgi:8-oxo-dGTP pyrophosphatase MutT (NUDIX family)
MIFTKKPENFDKKIDVVGCYVEVGGEILLLHRRPEKANGNKWGVPAGKVDKDETIQDTALREIFEETGVALRLEDLEHVESVFVRDGNFDLEWHAFRVRFSEKPEVKIEPKEHQNFTWISPGKAIKELDLIHDLQELLENLYLNHSFYLGLYLL